MLGGCIGVKTVSGCHKALDRSDFDNRVAVSVLFGHLLRFRLAEPPVAAHIRIHDVVIIFIRAFIEGHLFRVSGNSDDVCGIVEPTEFFDRFVDQ